MTQKPAFGRRQPSGRTGSPPAPPRAQPPGRRMDTAPLSPAAETFRVELRGAPAGSAFQAWNSTARRKLVAIWAVRVGLMIPGVLGLAFHLPASVSIGLELAGLATNGWLRRERRRHRAEILAWDEAEPAPGHAPAGRHVPQ